MQTINNYNPYLLKLAKSAMDIQINYSDGILFYLAKYLSKVDSEIPLHHHMQTQYARVRARTVGSVEVAYFCLDILNPYMTAMSIKINKAFVVLCSSAYVFYLKKNPILVTFVCVCHQENNCFFIKKM